MATYVLVDTANTFFRARHVIRGDLDTKVGMAFHITLAGVRKAWQDFDASHVVFCLEGRSWRKDFYEPYKRNRSDARAALTEKEEQEDKLFWEAFDTFKDFVGTKTNCTVLQNQQLEADDLIAGWVQAHPQDNHVIISTDGDFAQLIAPNCKQYNGITETTITHEGYFDKKGNHVINKKTGDLKWKKKHSSSFNSQIKIFENKALVIDMENQLRCFSLESGELLWSVKTQQSLLRSQKKQSLILKGNNVYFSNSIGDVTAVNISNGRIIWQSPTQSNISFGSTFFLKLSDIKINSSLLSFLTSLISLPNKSLQS